MPTAPISAPQAPPIVMHYAQLLAEKFPGIVVDSGSEFGGGNFGGPGVKTPPGGDNFGLGNTQWTISDAYIQYMLHHPHANAKHVYDTLVRQLNVIAHLGKTIGGQISTGATIVGIAGPAAGIGVAKAAQDITHGFNLGNILMRIGEIVLGVVLIGVGVAKLTGAANVVSKAVRMKI